MKRFLILISTMLAFSISAMAEDIDIKKMTTEELVALRSSIGNELSERGYDIFCSGSYVVGTDIKAGTYMFKCYSVVEDRDYGGNYGEIIFYADQEAFKKVERTIDLIYLGEDYCLNLKDGMIIELSSCSGTLQSVKPSWAP